ncbi:Las1-like-domain-containing protein [Trametes gibbosa]|nr:Las1-like-domain-containing protein [Trametes gibbosa]
MRLPRRVPWQDLSELEQICSWIYADANDLDAKQRAVNRLAAWKARTPPHALDSAVAPSSSSYLSLRMSYASAIIRLVNGLVDPLSTRGQLGLPAWFVELRHAATHEDLPSLEVLRDAAREAMTWLLHNYFLPTLNPSTSAPAPTQPLRSLAPLLKHYKTLLKPRHITKATRDVERWVAEAKVVSRCGKRVSPGQTTLALPRSTLLIWTPLLIHLHALHPTFPLHLVSAITAHLTSSNRIIPLTVSNPASEPKADPSYTSASRAGQSGSCTSRDVEDLRETAIVRIVAALGPEPAGSVPGAGSASTLLLEALCAERPKLASALSVLSQRPALGPSSVGWEDGAIDIMDHRLGTLLALSASSGAHSADTEMVDAAEAADEAELPPGWRRLGARDGWRPAPIGVYVGGS